jgi:hypothetical protein
MVSLAVFIVKRVMDAVQNYFKIWKVEHNPIVTIDVSQINKLDNEKDLRTQIKNLVTNPFRHKFMRVNREWIIHNIATILGGKNYLRNAGPELDFLQKIYQRAVNAKEVDNKLKVHFDHIENDLDVMPYNKEDEAVGDQISDDSISDKPVFNWNIPM